VPISDIVANDPIAPVAKGSEIEMSSLNSLPMILLYYSWRFMDKREYNLVMEIFIGADHNGFKMKGQLISWLEELGHTVVDVGAEALDEHDDYPDYGIKVAEAVAADSENRRGVLVCGSGVGMAVVADKAYSGGKAQEEILKRGLYSMVIKPRNSKSKDRDKDRFISSLRMPDEGVFSPIKISPDEEIFDENDLGFFVIICKCSGAKIFASLTISDFVLQIAINPLFFKLDFTISLL